MLWPTRCAGCDAAGPSPCTACVRACRPDTGGPPVHGLDACLAMLRYEGTARRLVTGLKYRNDRAAVGWLADGMAARLASLGPPAGAAPVVTWAPTSAARRRGRGFDQAELLATAVARRAGLPCRRLLARPGRAHAQTGAGEAARRRGPVLVSSGAVPPAVVLVDDVVTTGATLSAGARALRAAGAAWVGGLAAARTPRRVPVMSRDVDESLKFVTNPAEYPW